MVTKTIELEAKTDKAVKELEDLRKEVKKITRYRTRRKPTNTRRFR